jgi:hypothetical protein
MTAHTTPVRRRAALAHAPIPSSTTVLNDPKCGGSTKLMLGAVVCRFGSLLRRFLTVDPLFSRCKCILGVRLDGSVFWLSMLRVCLRVRRGFLFV